jgi:cell division protein ZapD
MTQLDPSYEFPLTEFIRTALKIDRLQRFFAQSDTCRTEEDIRNLVMRMLEQYTLISRAELKNELIKEVDKRALRLNRLKHIPEIDLSALQEIIASLNSAIKELKSIPTDSYSKPLPYLIDAVKQRQAVPGGQFEFDLPGYQYWLGSGADTCVQQLREVLSGLKPVTTTISMLLELIRNSATATTETATNGVFQLTDSTDNELMIIQLPDNVKIYPEISGGRHRVFIRFLEFTDMHSKANQTNRDISFMLKTCHI